MKMIKRWITLVVNSWQNDDVLGVFWTDFENSRSNMAQIWWATLMQPALCGLHESVRFLQ